MLQIHTNDLTTQSLADKLSKKTGASIERNGKSEFKNSQFIVTSVYLRRIRSLVRAALFRFYPRTY